MDLLVYDSLYNLHSQVRQKNFGDKIARWIAANSIKFHSI